MDAISQKTCSTCRIVKPCADFRLQNDRRSGLSSKCKACQSEHKKIRWRTDPEFRKRKLTTLREWRNNNPKRYQIYRKRYANRILNHRLKKSYGLTLDEYKQLCEQQNNICPICSQTVERLVVDHAEGTEGEYRGLLCSPCNAAIGILKHDILTLERAIQYLHSHDG